MMEIGRLCVKIAGRDAGKKCIIVDLLEESYVLIDGETRRRKCNIIHLEPTDTTLKIAKGASHAAVAKEFDGLGIKLVDKKSKAKTERPKKARKVKEKPVKEKKPEPKKAEPKKEKLPEKPAEPKETPKPDKPKEPAPPKEAPAKPTPKPEPKGAAQTEKKD